MPVQRIGLAEIAESPIDWMFTPESLSYEPRKAVRYGLRPHQKEALEKIQEGFQNHDRGKWISACGTGKTFTSLKLAERRCADNDGHLKVLFLAPSIALVSQTLREWMAQSQPRIRPMVVCSDTKASRKTEDITTYDIPLPTTDAARLAEQMKASGRRGKQMTVVFSTYQSIDVVARAQRESTARSPSARQRLPARRQAALHDGDTAHLRRGVQAQGSRPLGSRRVDGRRDGVRPAVSPAGVR